MIKRLQLLVLFNIALFANDGVHTFAKNSACKVCHPQIYKEFATSQHLNSTIYKDPIHNAIWQKHPHNLKLHKYSCGKCHTPAAATLDTMLAKGKATTPKAMPSEMDKTQQEGIACAYCHRIAAIELGQQTNTNIISKEERKYFGTLKEHINSPFHAIDATNNQHMQNGNVCIGCHSHKKNKHGLNVCSTNIDNEMNRANCVSCHMPKVKGSVSNIRPTATHTYHGFPGTHQNEQMLADFIELNIELTRTGFDVVLHNHASHAMLLHPLRVGKLFVNVIQNGESKALGDQTFVRVLGKEGKPAMPWIANTVVKNSMLQANETRRFHYVVKLTKGDRIMADLGYFLVNPKALKKLELDNKKEHKVFKRLKHVVHNY